MKNYCKHCGAQLTETQNYCNKCGKQIIRSNSSKENTLEQQIEKISNSILLLQQGNIEEFDKLYESTKQYVYYCILKSGVTNSAIEDIMQETYISIYNNLDHLQNPKTGLSWIKQIAFHKAIDYIRKNSTEMLIDFEENNALESFDNEIDSFPLPEDVIDNKETQNLIMKELDKLPNDQKKIIIAYYYNECKVEQIADIMGMPVGTIKTKLYRGRKKLKTAIQELEHTKNIKLHTMPIAPALFMLLHNEAEIIKIPSTLDMMTIETVYKSLFIQKIKDERIANLSTSPKDQYKISNNKSSQETAKNISKISTKYFGKFFGKKTIAIIMTTGIISATTFGIYQHYYFSSPQKTIKNFTIAYNNVDIDGMVFCLDEKSQKSYAKIKELADFIGITPQTLVNGIIDIGESLTKKELAKINIKIENINYNTKTSAKADCVINDGSTNVNVVIDFIKENNQWHIMFNSLY